MLRDSVVVVVVVVGVVRTRPRVIPLAMITSRKSVDGSFMGFPFFPIWAMFSAWVRATRASLYLSGKHIANPSNV